MLSTNAAEIDDPFAELKQDQLRKLSQVARIRNLLSRELIPADDPSVQDGKAVVISYFVGDGGSFAKGIMTE